MASLGLTGATRAHRKAQIKHIRACWGIYLSGLVRAYLVEPNDRGLLEPLKSLLGSVFGLLARYGRLRSSGESVSMNPVGLLMACYGGS